MATSTREQLQKQLLEYISETVRYIETVKKFCDREPEWSRQRESELAIIGDIKKVKNPEKKLGEVLKKTLVGLQELQHFLDAVERLAVTSPFVFMYERFLPRGMDGVAVQSVILMAREISSFLLIFKRDAEAFFLPNLDNVEVLDFYLHRYHQVTKWLCKKMKSGKISQVSTTVMLNTLFDVPKLTEEFLKNLIDHLSKLNKIRNYEPFRLTYLFNNYDQEFTDIYSECHARMLHHFSDLEETAVQLDRMKYGSDISNVTSSSVGIVGGLMSIAGLALAPFTAGVSLGLTIGGLGLGGLSAATGLVTGLKETAVNNTQTENAKQIFDYFQKDVQKVIDCLETACSSKRPPLRLNDVSWELAGEKALSRAKGVYNAGEGVVNGALAMKVLKSEEVAEIALRIGLQEAKAVRSIPKHAAELPEIAKLAKGTPLAISKLARVGGIGLNGLFIGVDIYSLTMGSKSLANGSKSEPAQRIRSRVSLWRSEIEAWDKISKTLHNGKDSFKEYKKILEQPLNRN